MLFLTNIILYIYKKMMMATAEQVLKVNREELAACMTCPLCRKLFRDATTISECLHSCEFTLCIFLYYSCFDVI